MASFSPFSAMSSAPSSLSTLRTRPLTSHFRNRSALTHKLLFYLYCEVITDYMYLFLYRIGVRSSYAEAETIRDDLKSAAIDVVADIKTERVPLRTYYQNS